MSPELRKEIELELAMLRQHLSSVAALLAKCETTDPDAVETMALGAFLHGFYNGIENIFKRIAIRLDGSLPTGDAWHRELLALMARRKDVRQAVISTDLAESLQVYMDFRHVFRHMYSYRLDWVRMADLVLGCKDLFNRLEGELAGFFSTIDGKL